MFGCFCKIFSELFIFLMIIMQFCILIVFKTIYYLIL